MVRRGAAKRLSGACRMAGRQPPAERDETHELQEGELSLLATLGSSGNASPTQDGHVGAFDGHISYASDEHKRNKGDMLVLCLSAPPQVPLSLCPNFVLFWWFSVVLDLDRTIDLTTFSWEKLMW